MKAKRTLIALFATGAAVAMMLVLMPSVAAQAAAFGTQVKYGENDFVPQITTSGAAFAGAVVTSAASQLNVTRVDYGTTNDVTDDCFYIRKDNTTASLLAGGAVPVVRTYDIRIVVSSGCAGKTVGTLVLDSDTAEKTQAHKFLTNLANACPAAVCHAGDLTPRVAYADVNNNNRYDASDCVFITAGARSSFATAANQPVTMNATDNTKYTIRLTACKGLNAGTLVFSGDADQVAYGAAGGLKMIAGASGLNSGIGIFDADNSGAFTPGDRFYVNTTAAAAASGTSQLIPLFSLRVVGDAGQLGSQVKYGDADFKPLLGGIPTSHTTRVIRVDYGTTTDVTDDCYYLHTGAGGVTTVSTYDVRIVVASGCAGKTVGSLVLDSDTAEKTQANSTAAWAPNALYKFADVNNNNRYDGGDCVFLGSGVVIALAGTTNTAFTIRLTPCSGKAAGTLVFSGDPDFTSYSTTAKALATTFNVGVFDADQSGTATTTGFTPGDRVYINGTTTNNLVPLYSIRLVGDFTTGGGGGPATTTVAPTGTGTGSPGSTTPASSTSKSTSSSTAPTTTPAKPTKTPGLELVAVVAGVAVVVAVVSRRKA